jgi:hypothetical protein
MDAGRPLILYDAIAHNNPHRLAAIQTRRIDLHRFSWKYPADRHGFNCCLSAIVFQSHIVLLKILLILRKNLEKF